MPLVIEEDMTELFREAFLSLPGVSSVEVLRRHQEYAIDISVRDFDRSIRDAIYRREQELLKQFTDLSFQFHVLDESPESAASDATFAKRPSK